MRFSQGGNGDNSSATLPLQLSLQINQLYPGVTPTSDREDVEQYYTAKPGDIRMDQIFQRASENNNTKRIGIVGQPGIGKSTLCKSLVTSSSRLLPNHVQFVFFMLLRHVKSHNTASSLLRFITRACNIPWRQDDLTNTDDLLLLEMINSSPDVMFILDGLDECRVPPDELSTESDALSLHDKATPFQFIKALLRGDIFSQATVLLTSRYVRRS